MRVVILFALGIILSQWVDISPLYIFTIASSVVVFVIILIALNRWQFVTSIILHFVTILLGATLHSIQKYDNQSNKLNPKNVEENVLIHGIVNSEISKKENKLSFVVLTDSVIRVNNIDYKRHKILVVTYLKKEESVIKDLEFGSVIVLKGILERFPTQRNPGEFDYGKYLELNGIQGYVKVKNFFDVKEIRRESIQPIQYYTHKLQRVLYGIFDSLHIPAHSSFLKGIVFGYRAEISDDVKQSFIDTGTIHILAVSGSNVAFVTLMFFAFFTFLRLPQKVVSVVSILGLLVYMLVTGSSPSVVRATIMAIVILCGTILERKVDIYNSLSFAALIILVWDTYSLYDIGFQLSFSAVLSIVYFYPRLESIIKKIPERFEEIKIIDSTLKILAVSLAAQIGTIPFTAYYFGRVSIISLLANTLVVPLSGLITFIGFTEVVFHFISVNIAAIYSAVNDLLVWFLLSFIKKAADVSFAYIEIQSFKFFEVVAYYLFAMGIFNLNKIKIRTYLLIFCLIFFNYITYSKIFDSAKQNLKVTMLDVGQGDAILFRLPNYVNLLIDTGPSTFKTNAGERTIVPFLKRYGINNLNYLLLTHFHNDHTGGAKSILKAINVDTLLYCDNLDNFQVREIVESASNRGTVVKAIRKGDILFNNSNVRGYVLHPDSISISDRNVNNKSIVLKIIYGNTSILLTGDAEIKVEEKIIRRYNDFVCSNILKVAHHGSITATSEEFLKIIKPSYALISVGIRNKFNHPSKIILKRLHDHFIEVDRTDISGAVIFESDGIKWEKVEWK